MSMDLVRTVQYERTWVDDPLRNLLMDSRKLQLRLADHVWLRIVDLGRAVALRSYSAPVRVVAAVTDAFCPWNSGTWVLELGGSGGTATRSSEPAQLRLDIGDLGAAFLGGTPVGRLAEARSIQGDESAVRALGAALTTPVIPSECALGRPPAHRDGVPAAEGALRCFVGHAGAVDQPRGLRRRRRS